MTPEAETVFWLLGIAGISGALSLAGVAMVLLRLPVDAFKGDVPRPAKTIPRRIARIGVNLLGWLLIVAGLLLSVPGVPGQGLVTILIGLLLVDFPGKGRLLRRCLARPSIQERLDRLRVRWGRPPFSW